MILDSPNRSLELILAGATTTNPLSITSYCDDYNVNNAFRNNSSKHCTPVFSNGAVAVTIVGAPVATSSRNIFGINIYNADTATAVVTVRFNDNGIFYRELTVSLPAGYVLQYSKLGVWTVISNTGVIKISGGVNASASTPTRVIGTTFQPSTSRAVWCAYTAQIVANFSLAGGQTGTMQLLSDSSNPPTTVRATVTNGLTGTIAVGLNMNGTQAVGLSYLVPPGDFVRLVTSGTATTTLTTQAEVTL